MTPPAATAAGASHGRTVRRSPAPSRPRRVSGPVRPKADPRPKTAPRAKAAPRPRTAPRAKRVAWARPLGHRVAAWVRTLPDHALLDRVVRGRTWIVLLGVLLAGIVAMQVEMLKLNSSIGRSIQLGTALQGRNELLRASVSALSDEQRIERLATRMGMVMPGPTSVNFLNAGQIDPGKAGANIHAPDPAGFASLLQATGAGQITPLGTSGTSALAPSLTVAGGGGTPSSTTPSTTATTTSATTGATTGTATATGTVTSTGTSGTSGTAGTTSGASGTTAGSAAGAATGGAGLQSSGG